MATLVVLEKGLGSVYLITGSKLAYFFEESSMSINFLAPETIHIMALKIKDNRIYSLLLTHYYLRSGPCKPVSGWGGVYSQIWAPFHSRAPPQKKFPETKKFFYCKYSRSSVIFKLPVIYVGNQVIRSHMS